MAIEQVGGTHYSDHDGEQHWDRIARLFGAGYFIGSGTAYFERCLKKGSSVEDLKKAASYALKLAELIEAGIIIPDNSEDPNYPQPVTEDAPPAPKRTTRRIK